tara:strand:- start:1488 stop:1811 length:324 start_codon:yes stop_codon:yes gene_type:complete
MKQINTKDIKEMIQEAASEYVFGMKNPSRVANQYKIKVLKQVIKEELNIAMREADEGEKVMAAIEDVPQAAEKIAEKVRAEVEKMAEPSGLDPAVLMQAVAALITAD